MLKQNAPLGCLYDDDDEDGGARLEMGVVASSVWWQQVARGGEWVWGSNRSGGGECFWGWSEKSRRKSFPAVVAWRRRWFRWPVFLEGRERLGMNIETELVEGSKVDEDKETTELQRLIEVVPNKEEVAIDAIPLATKPPSIVDYKIHKEGKKTYYQIIRADGSSKMYLVFSHMLKSFDREDLETLWKLVKAKHGSTRPEEGYERVLWGDLKTMFDPHVEDQVWRNQQDYRVLDWKLYDSCGVHSLRKQNVHIHMLVEKRYPLTPATITDMLNRNLQAANWNEICYQLLKLITKQLKNQ
ncbi:hypothetical protein Tco_1174995 [Tanacetum coccineum]